MGSYRFYRLDRHDKIRSAEWLEAPDDEAAIAAVRALGAAEDCELWLRNRLIDRIAASRQP